MLLIEIPIRILAQIGKHGTVVHVVSVDHQIVRLPKHAVFLHIGYAVGTVCLVKPMLQIKIRVIRGLHDGIVNVCPLNSYPTHKIRVLRIDCRIGFVGAQPGGFIFFCGSVFCCCIAFFRHCRFRLHQCGDVVKGFGTLLLVVILPIEHNRREHKNSGKEYCRHGQKMLFI